MRKNLKDARKRLGLTQKEMAKRVGVSDREYQHLEYGIRVGSVRVWDALEDLTGVNQRTLRVLF